MRADFHVHTSRSPDGVHSPREMVKYAKRTGLDAIAITDHNRIFPLTLARDLSREFGIIVIPGIEGGDIMKEKHWIALDIPEIPLHQDIRSLLDGIRESGGITLAPHPHTRLGYEDYPAIGFDAVEALNGTEPAANLLVRHRPGIPEVAGSDAHSVSMLGFCWTSVDASDTMEGILEAVRKGLCVPRGRTIPVSRCLSAYWEYVTRRIALDPVRFVRTLPEFFLRHPYGHTLQSHCLVPSGALCRQPGAPSCTEEGQVESTVSGESGPALPKHRDIS